MLTRLRQHGQQGPVYNNLHSEYSMANFLSNHEVSATAERELPATDTTAALIAARFTLSCG